ncbi:hypothetical protein OB905_06070 [Halobacteria archaeon AArc-dxtr1]|nr:hypothetical protein [Halobacteria archaeon AArc-dxtr1]
MGESERGSAAVATGTAPSLDEVFDVLSEQRRRYALYELWMREPGVATVTELTERVLALENRADESEAYQRTVRTTLQHSHLPKLEDAGVVEHDARSETVRYWRQPSVEEWLEHAYHKEFSRRQRAEFGYE